MSDQEKKYYTIGEVADIFSIKTSLLRFWETKIDVLQPKKTAKGNRKYTNKDIKKIEYIHHLVFKKGYTLHAINKILKNTSHPLLTSSLITSLKNIRSLLVTLKKNIS